MNATIEAPTFRAPEVCQLIGISYRQIDYWARTGLVVPSVPAQGSGTARLYSMSDLLALRVVRDLLSSGVSLQRIRQITASLAALTPLDGPDQWVILTPQRILITAHPEQILSAVDTGQVTTVLAIGRLAAAVAALVAV